MDQPVFDIEFEKEILAQALKEPEYTKLASRVLNAHHFGTSELSWCWEIIFDAWTKNKELPSQKLFAQKARHGFDDTDERIKNLRVVKKLFKLKPKNPRSVLEELTDFVKLVDAQRGMELAVDKLGRHQIEGAYSEFRKLAKRDYSPVEFTRVKWIEEFEDRQIERKYQRDNPDLVVRVPTNIKKLDRIITGLQLGELGLVMGTTSQGKSAMLTNLAYAALVNPIRKYKVAYFALEMPARQIAMRQDARWLRIDYNKFKNYDFTKKEKKRIKIKLRKAKKKHKGRFEIFSFPLGKPTINSIKDALEKSFDECGFRPDVILLDSPDHMQPTIKQDSVRLSHTVVYQECKALAEEDGYAVWASVHAGRDWAKKIATAEAAGESYDKTRIADLVLTLNTPEKKTRSTRAVIDDDDDEDFIDDPTTLAKYRYIELFLAKYRDGESRISIPLDGHFAQMIFNELDV